jgi:hypothetical protein
MRLKTETEIRVMAPAATAETALKMVTDARSAWKRSARVFTSLRCVAILSLVITSSSLSAQSVRTPVNLGTAGNYVALSETGITDVPLQSSWETLRPALLPVPQYM